MNTKNFIELYDILCEFHISDYNEIEIRDDLIIQKNSFHPWSEIVTKRNFSYNSTYLMLMERKEDEEPEETSISNTTFLYEPDTTKMKVWGSNGDPEYVDFINCTPKEIEEIEFQFSTLYDRPHILAFMNYLYSIDCPYLVYCSALKEKYNLKQVLEDVRNESNNWN